MSLSVCKFGGSSLADGNNISRVTEIIGSDPARRFVVVSALAFASSQFDITLS